MANNNERDSEEKFWSMPKLGKLDLKRLISHPNVHSDFRQTPINWFLIVLGLITIVFIIATEGFIYQNPNTGRWYFKFGLPVLILLFIILILIQGEWQRFQVDHQLLDIGVYIGFIMIAFITLFFYNVPFAIAVIVLIWLFRRYLVNRENRLAIALKG